MKYNKIWGNTSEIFNKNNVEIHRIEIKKGGFCSEHLHRFKYNMFYVESGTLEIQTFKEDSGLWDRTILISAESTSVEPNIKHKFLAIEDVIAYEIYWVELPHEDIIRSNTGGIIKDYNLNH